MRCLIDIRPLLGRRRTGVGQYAFHLTSELLRLPSAAERQYCLFGPGKKTTWPDDLPSASPAVQHYRPGISNRLLNASISLTGRPKLENLTGDFDVAWLPNLDFTATKKPYAVTIHDLSFIRFPEFFSAKQRLWHALANPKRLYENATRIIAVSEHTKADVAETYGIPESRITVISPAAGPEYRPATPEEIGIARRKYGLPERYFLFLGTIEPRKNIDGLIEAFETLKTDVSLVVAGGKGWLWQDTIRKAAASPARNRIKFLDYVEESDKPALYSGAIALTYPSFYEGFGMPPLEAMACGCPVIASHASSLGEVVGDAGLLIDPHDLTELSEAMRIALEEPVLMKRLSERGQRQAQSFSWQTGAQKLDILLGEIGNQ